VEEMMQVRGEFVDCPTLASLGEIDMSQEAAIWKYF
jgi:hypothetical protein